MPDIKNINLGSGTLYIATYDKTFDPHATSGSYTWAEVGYIGDGGVTLRYSKEYREVKIEKYLAPAKTFVIGEQAGLETQLLETQLDNIVRALGVDPADVADDTVNKIKTLKVGNSTKVMRFALKYVATTEDGAESQTFFGYNCSVESEFELNFAREEERKLSINWKMYPAEEASVVGKVFGLEETYT